MESIFTPMRHCDNRANGPGDRHRWAARVALRGHADCALSRVSFAKHYKTPGTFHGGTIQLVGVPVEKASYEALEMGALMRY
jgi:arylsulfatase